ncbi:hypothetical protein BV25DRAFT_1835372 [Artomyces pyxidatus]|uniref:Uncharacterized protein n=1 Tax=Artomyces pyxidatus TaxID=48021 RepID=A0ACB8TF45_9AGAM|nr:hypothetical protein BV25DRAFT_1835372 [Artomyces pyxidatus]
MAKATVDLPPEESQTKFQPQSSDEDNLWEAEEILKENNKGQYLVKWSGVDPSTGKPWKPTWQERKDCTDDLVSEWRAKQRAKGATRTSKTSRSSRSSTSTPATGRKTTPTMIAGASSSKKEPTPSTRKRKRTTPLPVEDVSPDVSVAQPTRPAKKTRRAVLESDDEEHATKSRLPVGKGKAPVRASSSKTDRSSLAEDADTWVPPPDMKIGPPRRRSVASSLAGSATTSGKAKSRSLSTEDSPVTTTKSSATTARPRQQALWTESQIDALREEEEESTQSQMRSLPVRSPPKRVSFFPPRGILPRGSVSPPPVALYVPGPSQASQPADHEDSPAEVDAEIGGFGQDEQVWDEDAIFNRDAVDDVSESPADQLEDDKISLISQTEAPRVPSPGPIPDDRDSPTRAQPAGALSEHESGSTINPDASAAQIPPLHKEKDAVVGHEKRSTVRKTAAPRKLAPIPRISPAVFHPHIQHEAPPSSIEQFSSPEKEDVSGVSSIQPWETSLGKMSVGAARAAALIEKRVLGQKRELERRKNRPKTSLEDILKRPTNGVGKRVEERFKEALRGMETQESQPVTSPAPVDRSVGEGEASTALSQHEAEEIREMEDMYVDLEGGADQASQRSVDKSMDTGHKASGFHSGEAGTSTSQDEIPPTASSKHVSDDSQSQSQDSAPPLAIQLASALELLNTRSETIRRLQADIDQYRQRAEEAEREQHMNAISLEQERIPVETQTDLDSPPPSQVSAQERISELHVQFTAEKVALQAQFDAEKQALHAAFDAERAQLRQKLDWAEESKASALTDVEFFQSQYQTASAYVSTTRAENADLLARAKLAESQATTGVALLRATFEKRDAKLQSEVKKYKNLADLLTERARRTDDAVRYRAAMEPELRRELGILSGRLEEAEAEVDDLKEDLAEMAREKRRFEKMVDKLKAAKAELVQSVKQKAKQPAWSDSDDDEDGDYLPGPPEPSSDGSPSSSSHSRASARRSPGLNTDRDAVGSPDPPLHFADSLEGDSLESGGPDDLVYLCRWRSRETKRSCQAVVKSKEELQEHLFAEHLVVS